MSFGILWYFVWMPNLVQDAAKCEKNDVGCEKNDVVGCEKNVVECEKKVTWNTPLYTFCSSCFVLFCDTCTPSLRKYVTIAIETHLRTQNIISQQEVFNVWSSRSRVLLGGFHWELMSISFIRLRIEMEFVWFFCSFVQRRYQAIIIIRKHGVVSCSQLYSQ